MGTHFMKEKLQENHVNLGHYSQPADTNSQKIYLIFWDVRPCSWMKVNKRFERTYRLRFQCRRVRQARERRTAKSYIPEARNIHSYRCHSLESNKIYWYPEGSWWSNEIVKTRSSHIKAKRHILLLKQETFRQTFHSHALLRHGNTRARNFGLHNLQLAKFTNFVTTSFPCRILGTYFHYKTRFRSKCLFREYILNDINLKQLTKTVSWLFLVRNL
jgi:hypothetical protein